MSNLAALLLPLMLLTSFAATVFVTVARAEPATPAEAAKTKFEIRRIRLGKKTVPVEMADDYSKREQGLMWRESLARDHGMLFIFDSENVLDFWMKNTLVPLSIGFFDHDKKLLKTHEMAPGSVTELHPRTYSSVAPSLYALEMPKGWFAENKITPGMKFDFVEDRAPKKK